MRSSIDPKIRADQTLHREVARATELLESEATPSSDEATADWTLTSDDRGRPVLTLTLSDFMGAVPARFAPDELGDEESLRVRLHRLWGDLLQVRTGKLIRRMQELIRQEGAHGAPADAGTSGS